MQHRFNAIMEVNKVAGESKQIVPEQTRDFSFAFMSKLFLLIKLGWFS